MKGVTGDANAKNSILQGIEMDRIEWYEAKYSKYTYEGMLGSVKVAEIKRNLFSASYRLKFFLTKDAIPFEEICDSLNQCWQISEALMQKWLEDSFLPIDKSN